MIYNFINKILILAVGVFACLGLSDYLGEYSVIIGIALLFAISYIDHRLKQSKKETVCDKVNILLEKPQYDCLSGMDKNEIINIIRNTDL